MILAGIAISMLAGDNSVLQKATEAKEMTDKAQIVEQARLDILAKFAEKKGQDPTDADIIGILNTYFTDSEGKEITDISDKSMKLKTKDGGYEVALSEVLNGVTVGKSEEDEEDLLPSKTGTKPFIPSTAFTQVDGTNLDNGLVITDKKDESGKSIGNEYVWIEVPNKNIKGEGSISFTGPDYASTLPEEIETLTSDQRTEIKGKLLAYTETLLAATGTDSKITKMGWTDEYYDGCGISSADDYNKLYDNMLKSVYNHGGFWIGRYEAGIDGSNTNISLARQQDSARISSSSPKAVSKIDCIPYNWVYCSEAQTLASNVDNIDSSCNSSLMFGVQWDCVLKYLKETGAVEATTYITGNSESWGNYDLAYDLNQTTAHGYKGEFVPFAGDMTITWSAISSGYSHPKMFYQGTMNDSVVGYYALSTGATTRNMRRNIYDLAGNMAEWTLEHATSNSGLPCARRGGYYDSTGSSVPASDRYFSSTTYSDYDYRFPCLTILT